MCACVCVRVCACACVCVCVCVCVCEGGGEGGCGVHVTCINLFKQRTGCEWRVWIISTIYHHVLKSKGSKPSSSLCVLYNSTFLISNCTHAYECTSTIHVPTPSLIPRPYLTNILTFEPLKNTQRKHESA